MNKDTQSWSNSNLTEMEELLQKMQQLETENADISHAYGVTRDVVKGLCEELANLKAENAALRKDNLKAHQMACEAGLERDRLRDELAALREAFAKADVLAEHSRFDGRREWTVVETWVYPNDIIVQMDRAAFDAARKEAKP